MRRKSRTMQMYLKTRFPAVPRLSQISCANARNTVIATCTICAVTPRPSKKFITPEMAKTKASTSQRYHFFICILCVRSVYLKILCGKCVLVQLCRLGRNALGGVILIFAAMVDGGNNAVLGTDYFVLIHRA